MAKKPVKKDTVAEPRYTRQDPLPKTEPLNEALKKHLKALINACATNDQNAIESVAAEAQAFIETI